MAESYQKYKDPFKRLEVAEAIIAEHRLSVNGRRLLDIEALLLSFLVNHCGPTLPDGWKISQEELAGRYGKSVVTISRALSTLRTEELIDRKLAGRNPARYTLGRAFFEYVRVITSDKSNGESSYHPRQVEMTASDKSSVPDPYLTDTEQDITPLQARARVSESQTIMLGEMLKDRALEYADVVANSDRIPGLSAELPVDLADLPSGDCTPLMRWLKEQPKKRREVEHDGRDCRALAIGRRASDYDVDDVDDCANYTGLVVEEYDDGLASNHSAFGRANLYHEHQVNLHFIDDMLEHYAWGGRGAVLTEIDKALNRPGAKNAQDITLYINDWLSKEDGWRQERSSDERPGRGTEGKDGGWGDTEAARRSRERIRNMPDVRVESEAERLTRERVQRDLRDLPEAEEAKANAEQIQLIEGKLAEYSLTWDALAETHGDTKITDLTRSEADFVIAELEKPVEAIQPELRTDWRSQAHETLQEKKRRELVDETQEMP